MTKCLSAPLGSTLCGSLFDTLPFLCVVALSARQVLDDKGPTAEAAAFLEHAAELQKAATQKADPTRG
jgi:hypothetical protein